MVQPSACTLRQASAPLIDAETGCPLTLAAALRNLFQFCPPSDSGQVMMLTQLERLSYLTCSAGASASCRVLRGARRHLSASAIFCAQHVRAGHVLVPDHSIASK